MQTPPCRPFSIAIKPGMRDLEVAAVAEQFGHSHGSEQGLYVRLGPGPHRAVFGNGTSRTASSAKATSSRCSSR